MVMERRKVGKAIPVYTIGLEVYNLMTQQEIQTKKILLEVSDGTTMPAYVASPDLSGPFPGLLVFQEAFGVNAHIRDVTERFAREGFTAIAPALYHRTDPGFEGSYTDFEAIRPHMQAVTNAGLTADIQAAYGWLTANQSRIGIAHVVGAVGYCMGGRASFLAATVVPLKAAVSYYGGGIAPNPRFPGLLDRVPDLRAPMLFFWGGKDAHIPIEQTRAIEDALRAAGMPYEQVTFSQADHGFFCDARPSYDRASARQSWELTHAFFDAFLYA